MESEKGLHMADKKQVPLGAPLPLSDADLDALATITPEDVRKAREFWKRHAPEEFKDLLEPILLDVEEGE
jgi:hypothetical protein